MKTGNSLTVIINTLMETFEFDYEQAATVAIKVVKDLESKDFQIYYNWK
ncbi:hypothetical protein P4V41_07425 [Fictibacillus nanhaiensis]|nr:hypothetical protein [Fictibacillus nanhaiensis]